MATSNEGDEKSGPGGITGVSEGTNDGGPSAIELETAYADLLRQQQEDERADITDEVRSFADLDLEAIGHEARTEGVEEMADEARLRDLGKAASERRAWSEPQRDGFRAALRMVVNDTPRNRYARIL